MGFIRSINICLDMGRNLVLKEGKIPKGLFYFITIKKGAVPPFFNELWRKCMGIENIHYVMISNSYTTMVAVSVEFTAIVNARSRFLCVIFKI